MKRSLLLFCAGLVMTIVSATSLVATNASPVAAQTPPQASLISPNSLTATIGYLVGCLTGPVQSFAPCLNNAIQQLLSTLNLPPHIDGFDLTPNLPTGSSSTPPVLELPASVQPIIRSLPPVLQTAPLANAAPILAPVREIATLGRSRGPAITNAAAPITPREVPIRLTDLSAKRVAATSSNPISRGDVLAVAIGGLIVAAFLQSRVRGRQAA